MAVEFHNTGLSDLPGLLWYQHFLNRFEDRSSRRVPPSSCLC